MRRAFQIAGLLLIAVLATGPAWAAIGCVLGNSAMGSSCPMGMTRMDADCPMSHVLTATDCARDCCNRTAPIMQLVNAVPVKPKLVSAAPLMGRLTVTAASEGISRDQVLPFLPANSPPRYIVLRVFRV